MGGNADPSQLLNLLEADFLTLEEKDIVKDAIKRSIKMLPIVMDLTEKQFEELKSCNENDSNCNC